MSKKTCMVMGLGGMGRGWLKNIRKHPDWECIGIIDTDTELLSNLGLLASMIVKDLLHH